ncbi:MAG: glycosyltransferase [bacterium]|nr:glycosyltransferase [bacterium]
MNIAVFHNFLDNIGGAEIVTLTLARELNAYVYTTNIDLEKIKIMGFEDIIDRIISIGKIPKQAPFRQQLALRKFRRLNLGKKHDFYIISGDWAISGAVNNKPNLWYVHSPLNELWQFKNLIRKELVSWWKRSFFDIWVLFNRYLTARYAKHVEHWVCNSKNTQERIARFYSKNAEVIYPPVNTTSYVSKQTNNYWLSVNRFVIHKRIEMQMEAFSKLPNERLIIVGSYEKGVHQFESYRKKIENLQPPNVEIRSWVDDTELKELYAASKGFITTTNDEDFGMSVIEAMASGKPVIAPRDGGYKESILHNKTGILIDAISADTLIEAIKNINNHLDTNTFYYEAASKARAREYDTSLFIQKIKKIISKGNI